MSKLGVLVSKDSIFDIAISKPQCALCGKNLNIMKKCARCMSFTYCDKICQTKDWPNHKKVCVSVKDNINQIISTMT